MSEQEPTDPSSQRRLALRVVLRTDVGLVRSENQDFGTYTTPNEEKQSRVGGRLLIVADGMGGHRGGATASRLSAQTVKAQYLGTETTDVATALREALTRANARIFHEAQINPELRGMGTTTSVLVVRDGQGWIAHVGDSRVYLVREGEIRQLTDDHSLVATMVREGLLTVQEAENHPRRNVLQRSMGVGEEVEIDVVGPMEIREGDTFILCSDGLHGVVKEGELNEIAQAPIDVAAGEFLRRALERGAPDNVTVIVARAEMVSLDDAGDEDTLDQTQPLDPIDLAELDAARDTERLPVLTAEDVAGASDPAATEEVAPTKTEVSDEGAGAAPASADSREPDDDPTPRGGGASRRNPMAMLMWMVVVVLALSAAGAWYYWTQTQESPAATSRR